ncbi:Cytochrome c heme lyase subunit CcmH [Candidatus Phaeomarinobacter ectocarpi]|uniref:Cytochrome c heme lyase subunit CcmH n=1 Tax=Candidatus Phaeomarinibacter ectocarpi TaxID=1458461 RepID=X5MGP2_9HYPH|nr:c-type cytochrome biogenesis protein CcmI [Candidatus Phaeomarinobacter ectocarpi]CDO60694.1 Cytochrome c heme lyase subunit CcmH [Candidatus Phaeomarinobacter ectocarpi]
MTGPVIFWIFAAILVLACAYLVLVPLRRSRALRGRADSDVAVYRDQLEEIDRDLERGMIGEAEAKAARTEISRRLLMADAARSAESNSQTRAGSQFAVILVVAMPFLAVPLYLYSGAPGLPSQPFAERISKAPEEQSLDELVARVEEHLRANPGDADGWRVVAPIYGRMGRFEDAATAYGRLIDLDGATAERLADLGESLVFADEGLVGDRAAAVFARAVSLDAAHAQSNYFLGLAALQEGDRDTARAIWQELQANADPDLPWARMVTQSLAALDAEQGEPSAEEAIASIPDEDRAAAIRGMVDGLDERLAANGGSEAEWRQLMRARMVLGETDAAQDVLKRALENLAPDTAAAARLISAARELGIELTGVEGASPE